MHVVGLIASLRYGIRTDLSNRMAPSCSCIGNHVDTGYEVIRLNGSLRLKSNETLCGGRYGSSLLPAKLQPSPQRPPTNVANARSSNVDINALLMKSFS